MGARITVQTGIAAGSTLWIERPVVRIGSETSADLSIPSVKLAAHAVTVEFRNGLYRVYNRSRDHIFLGGQALASGECAQWLDSDILELLDGIQLSLSVDEDPRPSPAQLDQALDDWQANDDLMTTATLSTGNDRSPSPSNPANSSSGGSLAIQLAVILFCAAGSVLLLYRHNAKDQVGAGLPVPNFSQLIELARIPESQVDPNLIAELQYAEGLMIRSNKQQAKDRYHMIHDALQRGDQIRTQDAENPLREQISQLVKARLDRLSN
jgi:hypothetical protein